MDCLYIKRAGLGYWELGTTKELVEIVRPGLHPYRFPKGTIRTYRTYSSAREAFKEVRNYYKVEIYE